MDTATENQGTEICEVLKDIREILKDSSGYSGKESTYTTA